MKSKTAKKTINKKMLPLILVGFLFVFLFSTNYKKPNHENEIEPILSEQITPYPTDVLIDEKRKIIGMPWELTDKLYIEGWKTYKNESLGIEISVPGHYLIDESSFHPEYINPGRSVYEKDIKIDIYTIGSIQKGKDLKDVELYIIRQFTNRGDTFLEKRNVSIDGVEAIYISSALSESYTFLNSNKIIVIGKAPLITEHQNEFDLILSSIKIN